MSGVRCCDRGLVRHRRPEASDFGHDGVPGVRRGPGQMGTRSHPYRARARDQHRDGATPTPPR